MVEGPRTMNLNLFMANSGYHVGSWRRRGSRSEELLTLKLSADVARQAEAAKFDALFIADTMGWQDNSIGRQPRLHSLEPLTTLSALAAVTTRIGLIGTASTTYTEPYNLARYFSSLDHLSAGRAGWNIVTSFTGVGQFSVELPPHAERYAKTHEYMEVVSGLWDSWSDDAVVNDREGAEWARPGRIRPIDHVGRYYAVAGPLNIPRSPQGRPVYVQAGSSDSGMDFAATHAEVIFTAQPDLASARLFYSDVKKRVVGKGRQPDHVKVLPGLMPIIGPTEREAKQLADDIGDLIEIAAGLSPLQWLLGDVRLDDLDLDEPIPAERLAKPETVEGSRSRYEMFYRLTVEQGYTLRQLLKFKARASGHWSPVGTAEQVADEMTEWFTGGASDGFNVMPPYLPGGLDAITDELVPVLQERGLFRREYEGTTLRDHLGLTRPAVAFDLAAAAAR